MISDIYIKGLHGLYNYNINLNDEQRVHIITGPNGYGKTTILKIIDHILQCKFWFFFFLKFTEIAIHFKNGMSIHIERILNDVKTEEEVSEVIDSKDWITIGLYMQGFVTPIEKIVLGPTYSGRLMRKYGPRYLSGNPALEDFDLEEILEREYDSGSDTYLIDKGKHIQMFLQELKCLFVKEQRLISVLAPLSSRSWYERRWNKINTPEINIIAQELKALFSEKQREFASKSQEIDATFIQRLIYSEKPPYSFREFETKLDILKSKIKDYTKYGLTQSINVPDGYPLELQKVLSLYIDDMEAKMEIFDDFYNQLSVFDRMLSNKALSNKTIKLNDRDGIKLINDNDDEIPLDKLSSGEQNLIILYYKLVFSVQKNSLLMIDEPENSLHAAWLSQMLSDYQNMADKLKCQIIIATHSPIFINGEWEMTFDLFDNNNH